MTGSVELDPDGQHLLIRFPYREDLVAMVKELPGRRWDPKGKFWRVPAAHVEQVFAACSRHLFEFAPEVPSLLAGTLQPAAAPPARRPARPGTAPGAVVARSAAGPTDDAAGDQPQTLTVSQLNAMVRDGLRRAFPDAFWVQGEIVDFDKGAGRQHRFFQLIEKARGEARPAAAVEMALFAGTADRLLPALAAGEPPLTLRDGLEVRVLVKVDLYVASGRFQLVVQDIDPTFTLGKLALTREQILRELAQKGLADRNRSRGFPVPSLRIGALTSPDADGWTDFVRHLQESPVGFDVTLFPIRVQGVELKPTLLAGLRWFEANADAFDVLCIVRGGGSRSDLAWFDDRDIALAVAGHPLKVVVGIGHQRDQSVLDAIAHSEKTPTAVAELLVRGAEQARTDLHERAARLRALVAERLDTARDHLLGGARDLQLAIRRRLAVAGGRLAAAGRDLRSATRLRLQHERATLGRTATATCHAAERRHVAARANLEQAATRLRLLDPRTVIARGFTIVRDAAGRVLPGADRLQVQTTVQVQFRDGRAAMRVERIDQGSP